MHVKQLVLHAPMCGCKHFQHQYGNCSVNHPRLGNPRASQLLSKGVISEHGYQIVLWTQKLKKMSSKLANAIML